MSIERTVIVGFTQQRLDREEDGANLEMKEYHNIILKYELISEFYYKFHQYLILII